VKVNCRCAHCRELEQFARDPEQKIHRFRARQDIRQHIESATRGAGFDMDTTTERTGSPQTLVCTKTRRIYQDCMKQYASDIESTNTLLKLEDHFPDEFSIFLDRAAEAVRRSGS
jgi:hypothetical protein